MVRISGSGSLSFTECEEFERTVGNSHCRFVLRRGMFVVERRSIMKTTFAFFLGVFFSFAAYANTWNCTNGEGLEYSAWRYSGGAQPPPDMVTFEEKWTYRGGQLPVERAEFDESGKVVLSSEGSPFHGVETYTIPVKFSTGWGRTEGGAEIFPLVYEGPMTCTHEWFHGMP